MKRHLTDVLFPQQQHDELTAGPIKRPRRRATATSRQPNYLQSSLSSMSLPPPPPPTFVLTDEFKGDWHFQATSEGSIVPCKPTLADNKKDRSWRCDQCSFVNWHWQLQCDICGVKPPFYQSTAAATLPALPSAANATGWSCSYCGVEDNKPLRNACRLCGLAYRPPTTALQVATKTNGSTSTPATVSLPFLIFPEQPQPSLAAAPQTSTNVLDDNYLTLCDDDDYPALDSVLDMELPD